MLSTTNKKRRPTVLALHGRCQSAATFESRIGDGPLNQIFDLIYVDAPFVITVDDENNNGDGSDCTTMESSSSSLSASRSWTKDDDDNANDLDHNNKSSKMWFPALLRIIQLWNRVGPFDGILGFSQGAALAGMIAQRSSVLCPSLKFAILCSGYFIEEMDTVVDEFLVHYQGYWRSLMRRRMEDDDNDIDMVECCCSVQTFHFIGTADKCVTPDQSEKLATIPQWKKSPKIMYSTNVGHSVPIAKVKQEMVEYLTNSQQQIIKRDVLETTTNNAKEEEEIEVDEALRDEIEILSATFDNRLYLSANKNNRIVGLKCRHFSIELRYPVCFPPDPFDLDDDVDATIDNGKQHNKLCLENVVFATRGDGSLGVTVLYLPLLVEDYLDNDGSDEQIETFPPHIQITIIKQSHCLNEMRMDELLDCLKNSPSPLLNEIGLGMMIAINVDEWEQESIRNGLLPLEKTTRNNKPPHPREDGENGEKNEIQSEPVAADSVVVAKNGENDSNNVSSTQAEEEEGAETDVWWEEEEIDFHLLEITERIINYNKITALTTGGHDTSNNSFEENNSTSNDNNNNNNNVSSVASKAKQSQVWKFVVGLVGKPSAGKSTFFNSVLGQQMAECAAHPFTTIEPNISPAYFQIEVDSRKKRLVKRNDDDDNFFLNEKEEDDNNANNNGDDDVTTHKLPCLVKDVAGLVPGAYQGRGKGNAFLNDLLDADALVHVVDLSGKLDTSGNLTGESTTKDSISETVHKDISFVNRELFCWILNNVKSKWLRVRKLAFHGRQQQSIDKFCSLFTGYHCSNKFMYRVLDVAFCRTYHNRDVELNTLQKEEKDEKEGDKEGFSYSFKYDFHKWTAKELYLVIHVFIGLRFPMVLACNKIDLLKSKADIANQVTKVRRKYGSRFKAVPVSGLRNENIQNCLSAAVLSAGPAFVELVTNNNNNNSEGGGEAKDGIKKAKGGGESLPSIFLLPSKNKIVNVYEALEKENVLVGEFVRAEYENTENKFVVAKKDDVLKHQYTRVRIQTKRKGNWQKKK